MAIDMMELWGGFPSKEMLKRRDWVKAGDCDPLAPNSHVGSLSGVLGVRAGLGGDGIRQGRVPPSVSCAGVVSTEQVSQTLACPACLAPEGQPDSHLSRG